MFQMMNEARIGMGIQGLGTASAAYLHALKYAKERIQGKPLSEMSNPSAKSTAIINHPDVRRMLLWMKSHVEGMRALAYLCAYSLDRQHALSGEEAEKARGIGELLIPICKAFNTDVGFRVCELAVQIYGGYGYCADYPVEQFLRDLKIGSIYEGTNGIQALDLVGRKLGMKGGAYAMSLFQQMSATLALYQDRAALQDLGAEVQKAVGATGEIAMLFAQSAKSGKALLPVVHATPFLSMMGHVCLAWLHFWQAGIADTQLSQMLTEAKIDPQDRKATLAWIKGNPEATFYHGKVMSARFFIVNVLPQAVAIGKAIKKQDMSVVEILEEGLG
jgi:hypothetical protein